MSITWTASNSSSYLREPRKASSMRAAVRDAKRYGDSELLGEGRITIMNNGTPVRQLLAGSLYGTPRFAWREGGSN